MAAMTPQTVLAMCRERDIKAAIRGTHYRAPDGDSVLAPNLSADRIADRVPLLTDLTANHVAWGATRATLLEARRKLRTIEREVEVLERRIRRKRNAYKEDTYGHAGRAKA